MGDYQCSIPNLNANGRTRTIALMGRTGNGKSATGNSILGRKAFESKISSSGVTATCECQVTTLPSGEFVKVIDTPGLFDFGVGSETICKEIVKSIELAKDGIDAILLVFSVRGRFTEEEETTIEILRTFFGPKITEYLIVAFTGGDDIDEAELIQDYLGRAPEPLQKILQVCKNRFVLFDNKTKDEKEKDIQRHKLVTLIDEVIEENDGMLYTDKLLSEFREAAELQKKKEETSSLKGYTKEELTELTNEIQKSYDEQLKKMTEMVETKLKVTNEKLIQQLADEKAARSKAEKVANDARKKSEDEARKTREKLADEKAARSKAEKVAKDAHKKSEDEARKSIEKLERERNYERNRRLRAEHELERARAPTCAIM